MARSSAFYVALCVAAAWTALARGDAQPGPQTEGAPAPLPWALPRPDSCQPEGGPRGWPPGQDAPPIPFGPGDHFAVKQVEVLEDFIPPFIWEYRDRFFYEGMRLEIGRCFADYGPPDFFRSATETFAGQARLTEEAGVVEYTAGRSPSSARSSRRRRPSAPTAPRRATPRPERRASTGWAGGWRRESWEIVSTPPTIARSSACSRSTT